jgi:dTDP-4-dehydrorhamnose reductase
MVMKQKILVTGANGQLGKEIRQLAEEYAGYEFIFLGREDLPIHHFEMLRHYFRLYHPAYLINCAAYTAVDRAESEKDLAFQVNGEALGVMAAVCKEYGTKLLHISTDYVFEGNAGQPYKESDTVHPQSVYGASKLEGERQALLYCPETLIIRTSWVYSEFGKNFVKTMLKLMAEKESIQVVNDQLGSPTYAADLAEAILQIIHSGNWVPGIFHFSNDGVISWYDFAMEIARTAALNCQVQPIPTTSFPTPAKRPSWSVLDKRKIMEVYGIRIKPWKESLHVCLAKLLGNA